LFFYLRGEVTIFETRQFFPGWRVFFVLCGFFSGFRQGNEIRPVSKNPAAGHGSLCRFWAAMASNDLQAGTKQTD
jgi:hypothetical protein